MNNKIDVLDKGFVRLIDHMGNDLNIVRAARVSYNADWRTGEHKENDQKLLNYLWKNNHTSPFESVAFTFEVKAPIFVFRQWHRHRTWSFNEISGRYAELKDEFYIPLSENVGVQSKSNKQTRDLTSNIDNIKDQTIPSIIDYVSNCCYESYKSLLDQNVPREIARIILPLNTYSKMFATVSLLNLLKFIKLRNHEHAQFEIREYAKALQELIIPIVPVTMEAFKNEK